MLTASPLSMAGSTWSRELYSGVAAIHPSRVMTDPVVLKRWPQNSVTSSVFSFSIGPKKGRITERATR